MEPLIITATTAASWLWPAPGQRPDAAPDVDAIIEEATRCREAGAAVVHIHGEGKWVECVDGIRARSDILVQCGMSTLTATERADVFGRRAEMISVMLGHHDEAFVGLDNNVLHPREELFEYGEKCRRNGVKPEFEVWHSGSVWNLNWAIERGLLDPPYITTLFLGWPGGTWSPPTVEEYLYRRSLLPEGCVPVASVMGEGQRQVHTVAIQRGDHIRVGTEDWPFDHAGRRASSADLVAEAVRLAEMLGRPVATVEDARRITGL